MNILQNKNFYLILFLDAILIAASFYSSYAIRFDFQIPSADIENIIKTLPLVLFIKISVFFFFQMYKGLWRYTSLFDLFNIIKAVITSSLFLITIILVFYRFHGYPRSVFLVDAVVTLLLISGVRIGTRMYLVGYSGIGLVSLNLRMNPKGKKLLIIGAGNAGEKIVREILENQATKLFPIGFLDDSDKQGRMIHGIRVLGRIETITKFQNEFDEILIAIPSASSQEMRRIVALCKETGKKFRTIPSIGELIDGKVSLNMIRDVTVQDVLGREEVILDKAVISQSLRGKRILITGAGGSIGSELVRQSLKFSPEALALVDMSEFNLFQIEQECRQKNDDVVIKDFLVDIRDQSSLSRVFNDFNPQVVFHAAAYKHVPLQEFHPWEAVRNNVLGTKNVVYFSKQYHVERFVLVSTDKAVRPTNIMGATKRVAEKLVASINGHSGSSFMAVRFGNVIGSSGSVIPIFQEQISKGGPVTVTHPEVTRYFMSIPEAAQLILNAGAIGKGGEIFILDMGKPIRIADLARDLIRFYGYEPDKDIDIIYTGLRPGEKLYEELITQGEGIAETEHEKILVLNTEKDNLTLLNSQIDKLLDAALSYDIEAIKKQLQIIVPEYAPN